MQIRDACRGDHQVSRNTLIEIARRKQERGMLTAWAAYQASLEKENTPRRQKDPNDPETFLALLEKTGVKIETIDTASCRSSRRRRNPFDFHGDTAYCPACKRRYTKQGSENIREERAALSAMLDKNTGNLLPMPLTQGRRPELQGGGLINSAGKR